MAVTFDVTGKSDDFKQGVVETLEWAVKGSLIETQKDFVASVVELVKESMSNANEQLDIQRENVQRKNQACDIVSDALEADSLRVAWKYGSEVCFPVPVPHNALNRGYPPQPPWSCCSRQGTVVYGATPMEAIKLAMRIP